MPRRDRIEAIGIDEKGLLWVKPASEQFPLIYREAMEIGWDPECLRLCGPKLRGWLHLDWFLQIRAVAREQGVELEIAAATTWNEIDAELRAAIERS